MNKKIFKRLSIIWIIFLFAFRTNVMATGIDDTLSDDNPVVIPSGEENPDSDDNPSPEEITVPTADPNNPIISVILPVIGENNPFNFIIDPDNILYNSFHDREGYFVEENANLLFINRSSDILGLSSVSDKLSVINQSTVPIDVKITATIEGTEGINLTESANFGDGDSCDLYLALVDEEGNEIPLKVGEEIAFSTRLEKAPLDAYAYEYDDETGEYKYQSGNVDFDTCSFGLKGACNPNGDWSKIPVRPKVQITWDFEPVMIPLIDFGISSIEIRPMGPDDPDSNSENNPEVTDDNTVKPDEPDVNSDENDPDINKENPEPANNPDKTEENNPNKPEDNPEDNNGNPDVPNEPSSITE